MTYREALVAWNPGTDQVAVGRLLMREDDYDWTRHPISYRFTAGAAYTAVRTYSSSNLALQMMLDFHTIVVRDGVPVEAAHKAFLKVDEYRALISPDTPGADPA
jgi:hypothetical protein